MKKFTPRPYQEIAIEHIIDNPKCALFLPMGMGKSASTLMALDILNMVEPDIFPALIIAPLRVARSVWPGEVKKWESFNHLRVSVVVGTATERAGALRKKADIYCVNYENVPWLCEHLKTKWSFKTIVADELTKLKGFRSRQGGSRARALAQMCHLHCKRFIGLTGTPAPNGLKDLWGQVWFLDEGQRLGKTYTSFEQRWFQRGWDGYSLQPLAHAQKEIESRISGICLSVDPKDYFDLKTPIETNVFVDLPPDAQKLYKEMERRMFIEIENEPIEAFNSASKTIKCLQLTSGAVYAGTDSKEWKIVHEEKIEALKNIIEEANGAPVIVAYHFKSELARLKKTFPSARVLDKNPSTVKDWNEGKIPILLLHPSSASHGLSLQDGGNILVFISLNWNLEEHQQTTERIGPVRQLQSGYNRNVFIYYILARNTIDEMVRSRLESKKAVQEILMEAMKCEKSGIALEKRLDV